MTELRDVLVIGFVLMVARVVRNLSVTALSNASADGGPVLSSDGSKIAVVTTKLRESGSDHDIHIINLPTTGGLKNKD